MSWNHSSDTAYGSPPIADPVGAVQSLHVDAIDPGLVKPVAPVITLRFVVAPSGPSHGAESSLGELDSAAGDSTSSSPSTRLHPGAPASKRALAA